MRTKRIIRVIHFGLIFGVLYQLLSAEWMTAPEPGKIAGFKVALFSMHVWFFGWVVFLLAGLYAMLMSDDRKAMGKLIPWFSAEHRAALIKAACKEIPEMFRGRVAPVESDSPLAGAVHGLGIMVLIGLGLTGSYVMLGVRSDGSMSSDTLFFLEVHEFLGTLTWIFLAGHVSMALYHLALGHHQIKEIFRLKA